MSGNSQRRGAVRKSGTKKGPVVGSGGQARRGLQGKGPTPAAQDRPGHPANRRKAAAERADRDGRRTGGAAGGKAPGADVVSGRNAVLEALQSALPATALWVLDSIDADDRVRAAIALAGKRGVPVTSGTRRELDGFAHSTSHQGLVLQIPAFVYAELSDIARQSGPTSLIVALDHVTDPHNLGAVARSALAFSAVGLMMPQRRAAPVTATAWKASAGALARLPVARVGNLVTSLEQLKQQGWFVLGLDGAAQTEVAELPPALRSAPLVLVVGSEGSGLARLTAKTCDLLIKIPTGGPVESLNASVAAGIALYELARSR